MPHHRPQMVMEELDIDWENQKRARWHQIDLSWRGFEKLDRQQQALLEMLRKGRRNADAQMKPFWIKEQKRAIQKKDWVLENIKEPVDWARRKATASPASPPSSPSSTPPSSPARKLSDASDIDADTDDDHEPKDRKEPKRRGRPPKQCDAEDSDSSESVRSDKETFPEGLEKDPYKKQINADLVKLADKQDIRGSALVLDAPESKLSSKALSKAGFEDIDVPNYLLTGEQARKMSKNGIHWQASQAFEHLAMTSKTYEFMQLDYCGKFKTHVKDIVAAVQKLKTGRPVIFATTFQTLRIPSEFKQQWKTEHIHQVHSIFEGFKVKVHETEAYDYRYMTTNVWVLERM